MSQSELISLVASLISAILAVLAIWLSIVFYRMSVASSEQTKDAAKGIDANVQRLEKLFDRLYADTFSMVKDTVSDMRRHIWPESPQDASAQEVEEKANERIAQLRAELGANLKQILEKQAGTDQKLKFLSQDLSKVLDRAISESRKVEAEVREESLRDRVIALLRAAHARNPKIKAFEFVSGDAAELEGGAVVREIEKLKAEGAVQYSGAYLKPTSTITVKALPE